MPAIYASLRTIFMLMSQRATTRRALDAVIVDAAERDASVTFKKKTKMSARWRVIARRRGVMARKR